MTQTLNLGRYAQGRLPGARPRLVTGRFAAALLASFGALTSFYLLLSVTPMYAVSAGAGSAGAGTQIRLDIPAAAITSPGISSLA